MCLSGFPEEFFDCRGGLCVDGVFLGIGVNGSGGLWVALG